MRLAAFNWKFLWRRSCRPAPAARQAPCALPPESPHDRLRRLCQWCTDGRLAAAEIELFDWQLTDHCPNTARTLLAALLARRGALEDALAVIRRADPSGHESDTDLTQLHVAVLASAGLTQAADALLTRFHHDHGDDAPLAAWGRTMAAGYATSLPTVSDRQIAHLAAEIAAELQVIPSLVAAQKAAPVPHDVSLLRHAIGQLVRDVHEDHPQMLLVCQALADLAILAQDMDDARRWAHRGLRINPYAASLALVLARAGDDQALGPPASLVLQGAIDAHPDYPDLRAAQVRLALAQGRADEARLHLRHWLHHQPTHPLAQQIQQELAA